MAPKDCVIIWRQRKASLYGAKGMGHFMAPKDCCEVGSIKYSSQRHSMPGACTRSVESPNEVGRMKSEASLSLRPLRPLCEPKNHPMR